MSRLGQGRRNTLKRSRGVKKRQETKWKTFLSPCPESWLFKRNGNWKVQDTVSPVIGNMFMLHCIWNHIFCTLDRNKSVFYCPKRFSFYLLSCICRTCEHQLYQSYNFFSFLFVYYHRWLQLHFRFVPVLFEFIKTRWKSQVFPTGIKKCLLHHYIIWRSNRLRSCRQNWREKLRQSGEWRLTRGLLKTTVSGTVGFQ